MKLICTSTLDRVQRLVSSIPPRDTKNRFLISRFSVSLQTRVDTKPVFLPRFLSNLHRNEAQLYIESSVYGYIEMVFMAALV
ncbi:hypothetical protein TNCV_1767721 [Trichonephila clavipes]|nr:hypothetical protein TNCV_1767721 [Trichonephila clavipes]